MLVGGSGREFSFSTAPWILFFMDNTVFLNCLLQHVSNYRDKVYQKAPFCFMLVRISFVLLFLKVKHTIVFLNIVAH